MNNYHGVEVVTFEDSEDKWRIFDKPEEGRAMVTPSILRSSVNGSTYGATAAEVAKFQGAAQSYIAGTGRTCTITSTNKVLPLQYEFFYTCKGK